MVFAGSTVDGYLGGYAVYGSLSMGSSSATANTGTSAPGAYVHATVYYLYGWGSVYDVYVVSAHREGNYAIGATANAGHYNPQSIAALGSHEVYYGSYSWTGKTDIGTWPSWVPRPW